MSSHQALGRKDAELPERSPAELQGAAVLWEAVLPMQGQLENEAGERIEGSGCSQGWHSR